MPESTLEIPKNENFNVSDLQGRGVAAGVNPIITDSLNNDNQKSFEESKEESKEVGLKRPSTIKNTPFLAFETKSESGDELWNSLGSITPRTEEPFTMPFWSIEDYIIEKSNFQKQIVSLFEDTAWYYFKVFFKFDTLYGLLSPDATGKVFDTPTQDIGKDYGSFMLSKSANGALTYLKGLSSMNRYYSYLELNQRYVALEKFINILSYISSNAPWFFEGINGLEKVDMPYTDPNSINDKTIEIVLKKDAIDMRIETLLGLYKFACFDSYNNKEIIPENLRLFDFSIFLFQTPLKYYQTGITSRSGKKSMKYKDNISGYGNRMSYKIITFKDCEIMPETFGTTLPGDVTNEKPFSMPNTVLKIKYKRCYSHESNEFFGLFFGDINGDNNIKLKLSLMGKDNEERFQLIQKSLDNIYYYCPSTTKYKDLIDATESVITDGMRMVLPEFALGNMFGTKYSITSDYYKQKIKNAHNGTIKQGKLSGDTTDINSNYYKDKIQDIKKGTIKQGSIAGNSSNINSKYYKEKLKKLHHGVIRDPNTQDKKSIGPANGILPEEISLTIDKTEVKPNEIGFVRDDTKREGFLGFLQNEFLGNNNVAETIKSFDLKRFLRNKLF